MGVKTNPDEIHRLLSVVTDFLVDWIRYQKEAFDTIDGVLILDDLIGFLGKADFEQFAAPYMQRIFGAIDVSVKALHNDCHGIITARWMKAMGANLFNFSFEHSLPQIREAAGDGVVLLGNIPPRDVLGRGTPADVERTSREALASLPDRRWLIISCGGGTPPGVPDENFEAMLAAVCGEGRGTGGGGRATGKTGRRHKGTEGQRHKICDVTLQSAGFAVTPASPAPRPSSPCFSSTPCARQCRRWEADCAAGLPPAV